MPQESRLERIKVKPEKVNKILLNIPTRNLAELNEQIIPERNEFEIKSMIH